MSLQQTGFKGFAHLGVFIFFELVSFILIINFNHKQKEIFLHSSSVFSGNLLKKTAQIGDYLTLQESNQDLLNENARLLKEIINMPRASIEVPDSAQYPYEVVPARIINNNITSVRNILTIDKGQDEGINPSMGVTTLDGVVGVVRNSNDKYASVLSLLNVDTRISASIKDENYFGSISWDGLAYNSLKLSGIPIHASFDIGDEIETNGFSTIFPKGLPVGKIKSYDVSKDGAFFEIEVEPSIDFARLDHVYILKDNFAEDIISLE